MAPNRSRFIANGCFTRLLAVCVLSLHCSSPSHDGPPARYGYRGRLDFSQPDRPLIEWENAGVGVRFQGGGSVTVELDNVEDRIKTNNFLVNLDGDEIKKIEFVDNQSTYTIATDLAHGLHTLWVYKIQEYGFGAVAFLGFNLDPHATVVALPAPPSRRIEFIGSSTLSGWGADGDDNDPATGCTDETNFPSTDAEHSVPRYTADYLQADFQNLSRGAAGIFLTFTQGVQLLPETYEKVTDASEKRWDFTKWRADAVVIEAGGSDFVHGDTRDPVLPVGMLRGYLSSAANDVTSYPVEAYYAAYRAFIDTIKARHPGTRIVLVNTKNQTGQSKQLFFATLDKLAQSYTDGSVVRFDYFKTPTRLPSTYSDYFDMAKNLGQGCQEHPNAAGSQVMAERLADFLRTELHWQ